MFVSVQFHAPACFTPKAKDPCARWTGNWKGFRADLDKVAARKTMPVAEIEPPNVNTARHFPE
jgi:hypothetical protein